MTRNRNLPHLVLVLFLAWTSFGGVANAALQSVDLLIIHGIVLTIDDNDTVLNDGFVAIKDGRVLDIGPGSASETYTAKQILDVDGDIVMPGLVNGHTHASMSVFRSLADGDGVGDESDAFPLDPTESFDTDSDGVGDNGDQFPLNSSETVDTDSDGTGNNADTDDDGDGVLDTEDAFPLDSSETVDTDNDGVGDNADVFPTDSLNGDFQFQHVDDPNTSETIQVTWETTSGIGYKLEVSTDLSTWILLRTYPPSEGLDIHSFEFSTDNPQLFIRLKPYPAQD